MRFGDHMSRRGQRGTRGIGRRIHGNIGQAFTLMNLPINQSAIVVSINAGMHATRRLTGMGITPGIDIKKISSAPFNGPVQIEIRGTRLAVGRGLAAKIFLR
ncbi:MAG: FeoA family protein [Promethearchaeota archaeon]